jgi:hypothetical protein
MAKMGYQEAANIRKTGLSNLIANRLVEGEGIGSSFTKSISERTKANVIGLKQKVDYLNIAKKMFGGSNLAPALLGRLTGRNADSIRFFAGKGTAKPVGDKATKIQGANQMEQVEAMQETLDNIYGFLKDSNDEYEQKKTEEEGKLEEKEMERKRRHDDLLKLLGYKPETPTATKVTEPNEDDGSFLSKFLRMLGITSDTWKTLKVALGVLAGPVGGLMAMAGFYAALWWLVNRTAENMTNFAAITPNQAAEMLQRNDPREMEKYGGREALEKIVKEVPSQAKDLMEQFDKETDPIKKEELLKQINKLGGEEQVRQIVKEGEVTQSTTPTSSLPEKVPPRPDTTGGKNAGRAKSWDNKFAKYYNEDGTLKNEFKLNKPQPAAEENKPTSATPVPTTETAAPVAETPASAPVAQKTSENLDLQLPKPVVDSAKQVINSTTVNSQDTSQVAILPMPSVRNQEPTFQDMILYSTRVV